MPVPTRGRIQSLPGRSCISPSRPTPFFGLRETGPGLVAGTSWQIAVAAPGPAGACCVHLREAGRTCPCSRSSGQLTPPTWICDWHWGGVFLASAVGAHLCVRSRNKVPYAIRPTRHHGAACAKSCHTGVGVSARRVFRHIHVPPLRPALAGSRSRDSRLSLETQKKKSNRNSLPPKKHA